MEKADFSEAYVRLCMTAEVKKEFGRPYLAGQKCIYKDEPQDVYAVKHPGGENTYIVGKGEGSVQTSDLTWIPTIPEIRREFGLSLPGTESQYNNFKDGKDPEGYGYTLAELSQYLSEEERWLLFGMWQYSRQKFNGKEWIKP
jgi:hypothetical protein